MLYSPVHPRIQTQGIWESAGLHTTEYTQSVAAAWRTFHHDGKISPGWWGWGVHAHSLPLYFLQSDTKLQCRLQLRGQIHSPYFISTPICTLWSTPSSPKGFAPFRAARQSPPVSACEHKRRLLLPRSWRLVCHLLPQQPGSLLNTTVATAASWRTFHHEGKISPDRCGARPPPSTIYNHIKSCRVCSSLEDRHTTPISFLPLCTLCSTPSSPTGFAPFRTARQSPPVIFLWTKTAAAASKIMEAYMQLLATVTRQPTQGWPWAWSTSSQQRHVADSAGCQQARPAAHCFFHTDKKKINFPHI